MRGGFDFGIVDVEGETPTKVKFQNENMIAFRGERLLALVPDLICSIDGEGNLLTNVDIGEGMEITYLGFAAHPAFRSPEVFGLFARILKGLGYEGSFLPIEKLAH